MNELLPIVLFIAGLTVGAIAALLLRGGDARRVERLQAGVTEAASRCAALEAALAAEQRSSADKLALLDQAERRLREAFTALSADALQSNNKQFLDLAKSTLETYQQAAKSDLEKRQIAIDETLKPVRDSLQRVDAIVADMEKNRTSAYSALHEQVKALSEGQTALKSETSNLVRALRTPVVRGRWGEIQLKRVVEIAGMLNYCDFYEQPSVMTEEGRLRPDLLIRQPGGKNIIVDAKAPLEAYLNSLEATDDASRRHWLKVHAQNVRTHINNLAKKSYWEEFGDTAEFVVMFLPGEMFFSAALEGDPALIEAGVAQRVIPASPTTLIALLRAVSYGWQQASVEKEAQAISALGNEIYKRLSDMSKHFFQMGKNLNSAVDAYNRAVGSLESRVLVTARKFKDYEALGIDAELEPTAQIEVSSRALQAPEMTSVPDGLFPLQVQEPPRDEEGRNGESSDRNREAIADLSS